MVLRGRDIGIICSQLCVFLLAQLGENCADLNLLNSSVVGEHVTPFLLLFEQVSLL